MPARQFTLNSLQLVLTGLSPFAATFVVLLYFSILHELFIFGDLSFSIWMLLLLAPPVLFEIWFTKNFEVKRHGWNLITGMGLAGRLFFIVCCFYVCVWYTLLFNNTPDAFLGLFRKWPYAIKLFWFASPRLSALLAVALAGAYIVVTAKYRRFRLQTTVILPAGVTLLLAFLLYMHPTSPLRLESQERPAYVQQVFPGEEFPGSRQEFKPPLFGRELYVEPSGRFAVMTFGASYGENILNQPNLVWVDLHDKRSAFKRMDQTRNFYSECPETIYAGPWHANKFFAFKPDSQELTEHTLPERVGPFRVSEIMHTYHACDISTVFLANTRNPVLFSWDTSSESLKRTLPLVERGLLHFGDYIGVLERNRSRGSLYLLCLGKHELIEVNQETLEPTRIIDLPLDPFDIRVSPDEKHLYITAFFHPIVWKLDADTLEILAEIPAPLHSRRVGLTTDSRLLFAAGYLSGEVAVINPADGTRLLDFYVTPKIEGMHVTERHLYLLGAEGMFRVALDDLRAKIGH